MATITTGHNAPTGFSSGETVTATKLNNHVNSATVTNIVNADISASADIAGSKLADNSVTQAKLAANVATTGPAFRAYASTTTSAASGTSTKVTLATEDYDTANCFASSRFTPNVAGYYQINGAIRIEAIAAGAAEIWKNAVAHSRGSHGTGGTYVSNVSDLVYLNGTTDYVELYVYHSGAGNQTVGNFGSQSTFLSGFLARAA